MHESGNLVPAAVSSLPECGRIPHVGPAGSAGQGPLATRHTECFRTPARGAGGGAKRGAGPRVWAWLLVRCPITETYPCCKGAQGFGGEDLGGKRTARRTVVNVGERYA